MTLSDHFRLQELDRIEAEKKNLVLLQKVFVICVKKEFSFSFTPNAEVLNVSTDNFITSLNSYYKGDLINYSDISSVNKTMTVSELLKYLKKL